MERNLEMQLITNLDVGDLKRILIIYVLNNQHQQTNDAQNDFGSYSFGFDPERDPRNDDDEDGGQISVEQIRSEESSNREGEFDAGVFPGGIFHRAIICVAAHYLMLGKFDLRVEVVWLLKY